MSKQAESAAGLAFEVRGLSKSFGANRVLEGVSFQVREKEILGVIGPSGCGKSTLLRCLDGLERFDEGEIRIYLGTPISLRAGADATLLGGADQVKRETVLTTLRRQVGFVNQSLNLWEEKTLGENLTLAPRVVCGEKAISASDRALALCKQFGIEDKIGKAVWQLSGGQKQRAAIIRALMMRPSILLLDEITSALDPVWTLEVMQAIRLLRQHGLTLVLVTHHLEFASSLCDRILFLSGGHLVQVDTPDAIRNSPANQEVARFLEILRTAR